MVTSELQIDIYAPRQQVWEFITRIKNIPRWQSGILSVSVSNGLHEGSQIHMTSDRMGSNLNVEMEIIQNNGSSVIKARSRSGLVRFESGYHLLEIPEGTRVKFWNHTHTQALYRDAEVALREVSEARFRADLLRLKSILETPNESSSY